MLRGSLRLGSLAGIPVFVHWTFLILIAWVMVGPLTSGQPGAGAEAVRSAVYVLAVFGCVVLHELGHALAARRYGIRTRDITLLPIGGVASLERMPEKPIQELVVAVAGPLVNVVIAASLLPAVLVANGLLVFEEPGAVSGRGLVLHQHHFLAALAATNVFLVLFNMVPALPMDGGRVLRAVLAMMMDRARATAIAASIGQVVAVLFVLLGLVTGHLFLMLIGVFVFLGAGSEAQMERVRSVLDGLPVRVAMMTRFRVLRASQTLREAAAELLAGSQQDFLVVADDAPEHDGGGIVGVLTRNGLMRALAGGRLDEPVSVAMAPVGIVVGENEDLRQCLERTRIDGNADDGTLPAEGPVIAVVRPDSSLPSGTRLVGMVTPDNLMELVMLRQATSSARSPTRGVRGMA
jgi:Zn-dependent protease